MKWYGKTSKCIYALSKFLMYLNFFKTTIYIFFFQAILSSLMFLMTPNIQIFNI